ncbi:Dedicator of cytokinesis protein 9 [Dermatophagoides pteronyssinus]|uniref:Dedicator of cytokinesis protein 9 n=1 Tax=Dermatophagoides pteronyssinus TaxID=6956 RepID=A0ABQ8JCT2_DERPT|nr:Dedicator of cytokinesis protein 9 [Dermatophagoides pteronyssinus]
MSERRFTRLKQTLSEHGTAAKTRETVSREIRQSLNITNESTFHSCIESDYECKIRQWDQDVRQQIQQHYHQQTNEENADDSETLKPSIGKHFAENFIITDEEDIECIDEPKNVKFDFTRYYSKEKIQITSPFSNECLKHYIDCKHHVRYRSLSKYFGTMIDNSSSLTPKSSSTDFIANEMLTSKSFLTNFPLRPHLFECEDDDNESIGSGITGQKMLIREGNASVIDENGDGSDFRNGWLTLSRDQNDCFLTFFDTSRRNKILWHLEINQKVQRLLSTDDQDHQSFDNSFRINHHIIRTDWKFIDDWIKDINSNIVAEFEPYEQLERILNPNCCQKIGEKLKSFHLINNINLFAAYNDMNMRKDFFNKFIEDFNYLNFHTQNVDSLSTDKVHELNSATANIFSFVLIIKSTDIAISSNNNTDRSSRLNESYFYRIALFDCKLGKLSEEFRYVVSTDIHSLRSSSMADGNRGFDQKLMCTVTKALFHVDLSQSNPNDLYLVLRVERTLHPLKNYICYPIVNMNNNHHNNNNNKIAHNLIMIKQHIEPYAWSIRPLFHTDTLNLETNSNFGLFYKMDQNRLSDEFILNLLNHHHHQSTSSSTRSQTIIQGRLEIELIDWKTFEKQQQQMNKNEEQDKNAEIIIFNPSIYPNKTIILENNNNNNNNVKQQQQQQILINPILEIQSLRLLSKPYREYFNILYIYPQSLRYDSQRIFSKARNLCVTIEIRDTDNVNESPRSLPIIYGRPHDSSLFVQSTTTSVSKHNVTPDFYEEIKVALPLNFSEKLHILFTFSHISCKKECSYSIVGYSWLPISSEKRQIHCQNLALSVFASLPNQYLSCQSLGLGKGLSMPDVKIVGKEVFKVSLTLTSSIISRDFELHNTLLSIIKITRSHRNDSKEISSIISLERQIPKMIGQLADCDREELIHFSQIILQQLFKLIVYAASQELIQSSLNTIIRLVDRFRRDNRLDILREFIDSTFETAEFCNVYIHDQLIILINKMFEQFNPNLKQQQSIANNMEEMKLFLSNIWFLLQIITKSLVQYLIQTGRLCWEREKRFDEEFVVNLKSFFENASLVIAMNSRLEEVQDANRALSYFMTRLCSFLDRSILFNAIFHHVNCLSSRDIVIQELKFNSIAMLLAHEHFVSYCNPMQLEDTITLTIDFCGKHFPVFLILNEFRSLYHQSATFGVRQIRQLALSIIRNQLTKHMLDDRYSSLECREKIIGLYLPILSVILENCNRMMDSTCCGGSNPNTQQKFHSSSKQSYSSFATIHEQQPNSMDGLNSLLVRSTSEISSTLGSISSYSSNSTIGSSNNTLIGHNRSNSSATATSATTSITLAATNSSNNQAVRFDKFSNEEIRDLFICFLCIVQMINVDRMNLLSKKQLKDLFLCLELALNCFEFKPKKLTDNRSKTMPNPISTMSASNLNHHSYQHHHHHYHHHSASAIGENHLTSYLLQQNLSIQSALITLRTIHLYLDNDQKPIDPSISQILSIYLTLMTLPQSQTVLIHLFNSIRYFVQKFSFLLFQSDSFLSPIISKVIRYCNSSLTPIRQGATDLLYCLFVTNMKRTRFETIVCVSRLASSDPHGLLYLHSSLNRLEQLAIADTTQQQQTSTPLIIDDGEEISITTIVERIREILKATKQIREEYFDPYSASELRLQLANSYARTSRSLLRTWLENLSEVHIKNHDWAEAAICLCQVIAILIEQLSSKEIHIIDGMLNISKVSDNIMTKDSIKRESDWLELEESHVSIDVLESIVQECVDLFEKAELYELAPHVLKVVMSSYEKEYEHRKLSQLYTKIAKMHSKAQEINDSGKRIFDTFFRVAFYYLNTGQKMEYIYKMTKLVSLSEMTTKMQTFYPNATYLAADSPTIQQMESSTTESSLHCDQPNLNTNSSKQCGNLIIVITHVTPYIEMARNQFEKNVGVQQFVYEQRLDSKIAQSVAEQYKKRVILTAGHSFPYFLKRIPVISKKEVILDPIDVAIDEMQERVYQLEHVIMNQDLKHLQLVLQGSVHVTVNCGPIAYANAFLKTKSKSQITDDDQPMANGIDDDGDDDIMDENFDESQKHLKFLFEQFLDLCESALKLNERLIKSNQIEYHNNLKQNFEKLRSELDFLNHRSSYIPIFDAISGPTFAPFS